MEKMAVGLFLFFHSIYMQEMANFKVCSYYCARFRHTIITILIYAKFKIVLVYEFVCLSTCSSV